MALTGVLGSNGGRIASPPQSGTCRASVTGSPRLSISCNRQCVSAAARLLSSRNRSTPHSRRAGHLQKPRQLQHHVSKRLLPRSPSELWRRASPHRTISSSCPSAVHTIGLGSHSSRFVKTSRGREALRCMSPRTRSLPRPRGRPLLPSHSRRWSSEHWPECSKGSVYMYDNACPNLYRGLVYILNTARTYVSSRLVARQSASSCIIYIVVFMRVPLLKPFRTLGPPSPQIRPPTELQA